MIDEPMAEKARITYISIWTRQRKDRRVVQEKISGMFQQRILGKLPNKAEHTDPIHEISRPYVYSRRSG